MQNKQNNGRYDQKYISPTLQELFDFFENKPKVKNLKSYIKILNSFVRAYKNYTIYSLYQISVQPLDVKKELADLESELQDIVYLVNDICFECRSHYSLTARQVKMLTYFQRSVEHLWATIDKMLCEYNEVNERLLNSEDEIVAEEVPYKKYYGEIMALPLFPN